MHYVPHSVHSLTVRLESQCLQRLFDTLALILPHESVVNVDSKHLLWTEGCVEQGCAHCTVDPSTDQRLLRNDNNEG